MPRLSTFPEYFDSTSQLVERSKERGGASEQTSVPRFDAISLGVYAELKFMKGLWSCLNKTVT